MRHKYTLHSAGRYCPYYEELPKETSEGYKYKLLEGFVYYSRRYQKHVTCEEGMLSDGATGAKDLKMSIGWWVHDKMCERCTWDDGSRVTNWQASKVLSDILKAEGRSLRTRTWKWATFLFGGWELKRKNGWFRLREKAK